MFRNGEDIYLPCDSPILSTSSYFLSQKACTTRSGNWPRHSVSYNLNLKWANGDWKNNVTTYSLPCNDDTCVHSLQQTHGYRSARIESKEQESCQLWRNHYHNQSRKLSSSCLTFYQISNGRTTHVEILQRVHKAFTAVTRSRWWPRTRSRGRRAHICGSCTWCSINCHLI